jgi:hypothetical protein
MTTSALGGVTEGKQGIASGVFNTSREIGGAFGVGAPAALAAGQTGPLGENAASRAEALNDGLQAGAIGAAIFVLAALLVAVALLPRERRASTIPRRPYPGRPVGLTKTRWPQVTASAPIRPAPKHEQMRLTKYGHACVRLEDSDRVLVIDPGTLSETESLSGKPERVGSCHRHQREADRDQEVCAGWALSRYGPCSGGPPAVRSVGRRAGAGRPAPRSRRGRSLPG